MRLLKPVNFFGLLSLAVAQIAIAADPTPITMPTISPDIPSEIVDGAMPPVVVPAPFPPTFFPIDFFDDFSWRTFIALNWPSKSGVRGEPDRTVTDLSDTHLDVPRVWETWKVDYEIFQPGGVKPSAWTSFDAVTPLADVLAAGSGKVRILGSFTQFGEYNQADFGFIGSPLIAQNKTYVRYEIRVNQPEFEFIVNKGLYLAANLPNNMVPPGPPLKFTNGSIETKAAWKELPTAAEIAAAKGKFYIISARVPPATVGDPSPTKTFALVGFHIVQKTPIRPQWVWSSFEHIDNVPDPDAVTPVGAKFSFNDFTKPQKLDPDHLHAPDPLSSTNPPLPDPTPMQVVRGVKDPVTGATKMQIHPKTKATNARYQAKLAGTVWANYQLVTTQWPTKVAPDTDPGAPFPGNSATTCCANSVMETYFQESGTSSCMACHDQARDSNTDFVWFVQLRAFTTSPVERSARMKSIADFIERLKPAEKQIQKRLLK